MTQLEYQMLMMLLDKASNTERTIQSLKTAIAGAKLELKLAEHQLTR